VSFRTIRIYVPIVLGIVLCTAAAGQQQRGTSAISIRVPVLGFIFDEQTRLLRSLFGGPESSILSEPWSVESFKKLAVARRNGFGLAILDGSNQPVIVDFGQRAAAMQTLPELTPGADSIVLSPSGVAAAVYYRDCGCVRVLKGLPYHTTLTGTAFLRPEEQPRTLAVSDDAAALLANVEDGGLNSIVLLSIDRQSRRLFSTDGRAPITFFNDSHDAVIVDEGSASVFRLRDPAGSAELTALPGIKESVGTPVGTGLSYDNQYAFFAGADTALIAKVELATGWITVTPCACTPEGLSPLGRNALFRLNVALDGPIWIYDATEREPRTYVLPVYTETAQSELVHQY